MEKLDPYAAYAAQFERKTPYKPRAPKVVLSDKDAPMKPTAQEQQRRDNSELLARFKRAKKAAHEALLESAAHGKPYAVMMAIVKRLPLSSAELVENLKTGWTGALSPQEKLVALSMINARIMHEREVNGLSPMSDPMPDEPPNLFLICRKLVTGI